MLNSQTLPLNQKQDNAKMNGTPIRKSAIYAWLVCGLGALFYCYEYFLRLSPNVMTDDLMRVYHIDAALLGNLSATYLYAYTPMQLPVGVLMDRYGPRRLLVFACLLCSIGTYLFAESGHLGVAQIGRFMVGFGSAFAFVGVLKLATIWLPPQRFAMIVGIATALGMTLGGAVGEVALAQLVNLQGWHKTVIISAVMGIVLSLIISLILRDDPQATTGSGSYYRTSSSFKQLFTGLYQLLKNPQMWIVGLAGCLFYLPTSAFAELWGIPYLERVYGLANTAAAGAISMIFLGWAFGGPIIGLISDRLMLRRTPMLIGSVIGTVVLIAVLYMPHLTAFSIGTLLFLLGVCSSVENITFAIGREISPSNLAGTAIALTNMLIMMGGVVFQPVIGILLDWRWDGSVLASGVRVYPVNDYKYALLILPIGFLLAGVLTLFLKETRCQVVEE